MLDPQATNNFDEIGKGYQWEASFGQELPLSIYPSALAAGVKRKPTCLESEAADDRWQMSAILGDASQFLRIVKEHINENSHTKMRKDNSQR